MEPLPAADGAGIVAFFEESRSAGELLHLVIADTESADYLGEVMLAPGQRGVAEVGCCLTSTARGRGIATEALALVTDWALAALPLDRVQAVVARENGPALRLVGRAGFRLDEGHRDDPDAPLDFIVLFRGPNDPNAGA